MLCSIIEGNELEAVAQMKQCKLLFPCEGKEQGTRCEYASMAMQVGEVSFSSGISN